MKITVPGSIGGMKVAIAWPNMWLSGSRFRNRSGKERLAPFPVLEDLVLDRDDVRQDVAVGDDDALGLGGRAGREDDLGDVVVRDRDGGQRGRGVGDSSRARAASTPARRSGAVNGGTSWPIRISRAETMR